MTAVPSAPLRLSKPVLSSPDSNEVSSRVYAAQLAAWWAALVLLVPTILIVMAFSMVPVLRFALAPFAPWLLALALARMLLSIALFVLAGVLIGQRRRSGAVVALVVFLLNAIATPASSVLRHRNPGLTIVFTALALVGAILVIRAWPEMRSSRTAVGSA